jgi:hypothetical protein
MRAYSDPNRESDPYALPDLELFKITDYRNCPLCAGYGEDDPAEDDGHNAEHEGWYWQSCFPGCLPDSEPVGPFATQEEALADAREGMED